MCDSVQDHDQFTQKLMWTQCVIQNSYLSDKSEFSIKAGIGNVHF